MYTHYYTIKEYKIDSATWENIIKDFKKIIKKSEVKMSGTNLFGNDYIMLNTYDERNEPLMLSRFGINSSCTTDKKPYDIVVVACLIACKYHFKDHFELRSDGKFTELWPGMELFMKACKE